ncbi:MAG TPA: short chain dehydrogenase [Microscillaceae bacterium]|jgi:short-subunit dehydrogenase|nr:short chain dehydrogenase [Microscillaceae bacterium]
MSSFQNQVVWITGASSGIGEALAVAFAHEGAVLVLSARRESELQRVAQMCQGAKEVFILPLDLTDSASLVAKTQEVVAKFGKIDVLVNNGGISQRGFVKDTNFEVDRRIMEVNFFGTIALTKAVLPVMLQQKSGKIAVVSSLVGKFGTPLRSAYSASKHALHGYFDALRAEVWNDGIRVLMACPGFIKTNVSYNALTADGSPQNSMDDGQAKGMSAERCAAKIISGLKRNKEEIYIAGWEKIGLLVKRFFPSLFSRMIRRMKVT